MAKKPKDMFQERKERVAYSLFYFFLAVFIIKTILGIITSSKALLLSGIFSLLGVLISATVIIRIIRPKRSRFPGKASPEKIEKSIIFWASVIIAATTFFLLFSVGHMLFYHSLYPPQMNAAWAALFCAALNFILATFIKKKIGDIGLNDCVELISILEADLLLAVLTSISVVLSRSGAYIIDYILSFLIGVCIIAITISYLFRSLKTLLDASCDTKIFASINKIMTETVKGGQISDLKICKSGESHEISAVLNVPKEHTILECKDLIASIRDALNKNFSSNHTLYIGLQALQEQAQNIEEV
ncbi:MAG: cation transporter [Candidatus Omnitrophica bacterium]|nr:cation transporter [Candidatus Omnitrophota bacterium]